MYILITFYPVERDTGQTAWLVYGHKAPGCNEALGEYSSRADAIQEAFAFGVPVMMGMRYEAALIKLSS